MTHIGLFQKSTRSSDVLLLLSLLIIACSSCSADSISESKAAHASRLIADDQSGVSKNRAFSDDLPILDEDAVMSSLPWIISTLELKKHGYEDFQITDYVLSPNKHYAVINVSNGKRGETPGPFYRFLVCNPKANRIFYPSMEYLHSSHRDSYIAVKFNDEDTLAIAFGYRTIAANIVSLPDGKLIKRQVFDLFEKDEIDKELSIFLEQNK